MKKSLNLPLDKKQQKCYHKTVIKFNMQWQRHMQHSGV